MLKYNIHCLFNWLEGARTGTSRDRLKNVASDRDVWAVSYDSELCRVEYCALGTGMRRVAVCGVEGVR